MYNLFKHMFLFYSRFEKYISCTHHADKIKNKCKYHAKQKSIKFSFVSKEDKVLKFCDFKVLQKTFFPSKDQK